MNKDKLEDLIDETEAKIMDVVYEWARINFGVEDWAQDATEIREIIRGMLESINEK